MSDETTDIVEDSANDDETGEESETTEVAPAPLEDIAADGAADDDDSPVRDVSLLAGIEVELSVELGRARMPMRKLLTLTPGRVVDLDRPAGSTVDILVNGTAIARGEVVVVDGDFGVRVTEILRDR